MKKLSKKDLQLNPVSISKLNDVSQNDDITKPPKTHDVNDHDSCMQCIATIGVDCETKASFCLCESYECSVDCGSDGCGNYSDGCGGNLSLSCECNDDETKNCQEYTDACRTKECNTVDPCNLSDAYCDQSLWEYVCESKVRCLQSDGGCEGLTQDECAFISNGDESCDVYGCGEETLNMCDGITATHNCVISVDCGE